MYDERCSTVVAHTVMNATDTRGKKRKMTVDRLSAEIILQDYLDSKKR
jgi:putative Holliday junction resolvase